MNVGSSCELFIFFKFGKLRSNYLWTEVGTVLVPTSREGQQEEHITQPTGEEQDKLPKEDQLFARISQLLVKNEVKTKQE